MLDRRREPFKMDISQDKLFKTHLIIHSSATAAAITAGALAGIPILGPAAGGSVILTAITAGMVVAIGGEFGQNFETSAILGLAGQFLAMTIGTSLLQTALSIIPGLGTVSNALLTFGVTESIGWAAYLLFKEGRDITRVDQAEFKIYMDKGEGYATQVKREFAWMDDLPPHIKAQYDYLTKKLSRSDLTDDERQAVLHEIEALITPYKPASKPTE
jgi:uncharacterized protein (DUF697 family)